MLHASEGGTFGCAGNPRVFASFVGLQYSMLSTLLDCAQSSCVRSVSDDLSWMASMMRLVTSARYIADAQRPAPFLPHWQQIAFETNTLSREMF